MKGALPRLQLGETRQSAFPRHHRTLLASRTFWKPKLSTTAFPSPLLLESTLTPVSTTESSYSAKTSSGPRKTELSTRGGVESVLSLLATNKQVGLNYKQRIIYTLHSFMMPLY
ncbi:hypothetical protein ACFX1Q_001301 [Malus domestica]